ncbi:MAG: CPBP family intramembrane glutamic endopeptidase [Candidatus Thorarchaeota archaeon]
MRGLDELSSAPRSISDQSGNELSQVRTSLLLVELSIVMLFLFGLTFFVGGAAFGIPIVYILVDSVRRGRRKEDLGLKQGSLVSDLHKSASLVVLGVIVIQSIIILGSLILFPPYLQYIKTNRAWSIDMSFGMFVFMLFSIPLTTMLEEVVFRGLVQERLGWFFNKRTSLTTASFLFAAIHWTPNDLFIILIDWIAIAAGGFVYGLIYMRCRNVYIAWFAHMFSDLHGIVLLFIIFNIL